MDDHHLGYFKNTSLKEQGVCQSHCGIAIYIKKYRKAKEELREFKYFTMQKHNLQKNSPKETKILQDTIPLQVISSFKHKPKYIIFQKSSHKNRPYYIT
jgi:hypothetical protein